MKAITLAQRYLTAFMAGALGFIVLLMPYHAFVSTWLGTLIGPMLLWKSWKELLLGLVVLAAIATASIKPDIAKTLLKRPLTLIILGYALLHIIVALLFANPIDPTIAGLMTNLRFLAIFLAAQVFVLAMPAGGERLRQFLTKTLLISTVIVSVFGLLQVSVLPKDFLTPFGYNEELTIAPYILVDEQEGAFRAFSTLRGPNTLGMFLLLPISILAVLIYRGYKRRLMIPALGLALMALFATGARSAWIGAFVAACVLLLVVAGKMRTLTIIRRWGIPTVVVLAVLVVAAFEYPPLRLAIFHSNPDDPSLTEGSTDKHLQATIEGAQDAFAHPFGRGPGQAGPASFYAETPRIAENYYVQIAQEVGIVGLILLLAILFLVARSLWRLARQKSASALTLGLLASFWGIAAINMLLHGWADDPTSLVWWALAGMVLARDNN